MKSKTLVLTVNFKNHNPTRDLIASIEKCENSESVFVVIIDNESTKKSYNELNKIVINSSLKTLIVPFKKNYFYWPAIKKSLAELKEKKAKWTIVCNNDILIDDVNFFNKLYSLDSKTYHVIGAKIIDEKNKNLNPFMIKPMSKFRLFYWNLFFKSYYISIFLKVFKSFKNFKSNHNNQKTQEVYAIHGSAMIFSKYFFDSGGWLDDNFKLFCEELSTAEISKKVGCKIFYIPYLMIKHNSHTASKKLSGKELYNYAKSSHFYFINKYLKK